MRDYRALLAGDKCWDASTQALFEAHGEPLEDAILQQRDELVAFCELIEDKGIRSYLEIGVWTGALVRALGRIFHFDPLAACDDGYAEKLGLTLTLPPATRFLRGHSGSDEYRRFRESLGHVDLVFIDADHHERAVARDFAINRAYPHRFLAFHDIAGVIDATSGAARFWRALDTGFKREICAPGSTMGIGIWSASEPP